MLGLPCISPSFILSKWFSCVRLACLACIPLLTCREWKCCCTNFMRRMRSPPRWKASSAAWILGEHRRRPPFEGPAWKRHALLVLASGKVSQTPSTSFGSSCCCCCCCLSSLTSALSRARWFAAASSSSRKCSSTCIGGTTVLLADFLGHTFAAALDDFVSAQRWTCACRKSACLREPMNRLLFTIRNVTAPVFTSTVPPACA